MYKTGMYIHVCTYPEMCIHVYTLYIHANANTCMYMVYTCIYTYIQPCTSYQMYIHVSEGMQARGAGGPRSTTVCACTALEDNAQLSSLKDDEESFFGFAPVLDLRFFFTGQASCGPAM